MPLTPPNNGAGIQRPTDPQIPPTLMDVTNAKEYANRLLSSKTSGYTTTATDNEIGSAEQYTHEVVLARTLLGENAPSWIEPITQTLQQLAVGQQQLIANLQRVEVRLENSRIARINRLEITNNTGVTAYRAKQKEVIGDGVDLANAIAPTSFGQIAPLAYIPQLGTFPSEFIATSNMTHQTILDLVRFYNNDFGIRIDDLLAARAQKIANWLMSEI